MEIILQNREKLYNLIWDKNIVLVGPATYLNKKEFGLLIDKYDLVIRCNRGHGLIKDKKNYGSRTDILYHCVNDEEDNGGKITDKMLNDIKYIVGAYPCLTPFDKSTFQSGTIRDYNKLLSRKELLYKFTSVEKKSYLRLEEEVGCRPNTGISAIYDILLNNPKKLYITGFTLFKDGYSKHYRDKIDKKTVTEESSKYAVLDRMTKETYVGSHDQYLIYVHLKKMILNNDKVKLDNELKKILELDIKEYGEKNHLGNKTDKEIFYYYLYNE